MANSLCISFININLVTCWSNNKDISIKKIKEKSLRIYKKTWQISKILFFLLRYSYLIMTYWVKIYLNYIISLN